MAPPSWTYAARYPMRMVLLAVDEPASLMRSRICPSSSSSSSSRGVQHLRPILFNQPWDDRRHRHISVLDGWQWLAGCHVTDGRVVKGTSHADVGYKYSECRPNEEYTTNNNHQQIIYRTGDWKCGSGKYRSRSQGWKFGKCRSKLYGTPNQD